MGKARYLEEKKAILGSKWYCEALEDTLDTENRTLMHRRFARAIETVMDEPGLAKELNHSLGPSCNLLVSCYSP